MVSRFPCGRTHLYITILVQAAFIVQLYFYSQEHVTILKQTDYAKLKPHIVFGILSIEKNRELRDASRNTWISTAQHADIPFKLTYKFLMDLPTKTTIEENIIHNDIVYLNVTHHGYATKYGEKIYTWMKYIVKNYPDAFLGARVDDDVFLCVPQIFDQLDLIKSSKLYYGWAHGSGNKINARRRVDEMFVVFGRELMQRIVQRQYCDDKEKCNVTEQLVDLDYGGVSLGTWLSIYDDIDFKTDNRRIIHFGRNQEKKYAHYVKANFCEKWFLYHKSTADIMRQLHVYNKESIRSQIAKYNTDSPGATTGLLFSGAVVRELPSKETYSGALQTVARDGMKHCDTWAVVTTIFSQSEAVRTVANEPKWCLVIVADAKTPAKKVYLKDIDSAKVKFLSVGEQNDLYPLLAASIPLNNFARKNIGYVYAIQHGAQAIWDFDDDNIGIIDLNDLNSSSTFVTICQDFNSLFANPYPYFGVKNNRTWPRGFPLQYIKRENTLPRICKSRENVKLGVVQSLANIQPDVDAIYRLTNIIPFSFTAKKETHSTLVMPKTVYAPFNAQATLWLSPAFKYMALPVSVNGRVSDIWRAYVAQHFMHKDGTHLAFSIPYVTQIRNEHEDMKDFNAELDLYQKSRQLVDFLSSKECSETQSLMAMYEHLYRREYLDSNDLKFMNAWIQTFQSVSKVQ